MALPRPLLDIAERQHSAFSLSQARANGVTLDMLDNRRASGELWSPHRCVYVVAGSPRTWEQRLMCACLGGGPGTVVGHVAAIRKWELLDIDDPPVEVNIPRMRSPRFADVTNHRHLDMRPEHTTIRDGLPITNPLRTMVDAAGDLDREQLQEALDAGISQKLFSLKAVDRMRARLAKPGKNGPGKLRALIEDQVLRDRDRTVLEAHMGRLWRRFGLPPYEFQHTVRDDRGRFVARPDFTIVDAKVIVEVNGWGTHASLTAVDGDGRRAHKLLALGWIILTFSWNRVKHESAAVAAEIDAVVSARLAG